MTTETPAPAPDAPTDAELAKLRRYVGAGAESTELLTDCWTEAAELVARHVRELVVPEAIVQRAVLDTASELFHRRNAPSGIMQVPTDVGAAPVRLARDPMQGAYAILAPWVGLGIG